MGRMQTSSPGVQFHCGDFLCFSQACHGQESPHSDQPSPASSSLSNKSLKEVWTSKCSLAPNCQGHAAEVARQTCCLDNVSEQGSPVLEDSLGVLEPFTEHDLQSLRAVLTLEGSMLSFNCFCKLKAELCKQSSLNKCYDLPQLRLQLVQKCFL